MTLLLRVSVFFVSFIIAGCGAGGGDGNGGAIPAHPVRRRYRFNPTA